MRRRPSALVLLILAIAGLTGCGQTGPNPVDAVQSYISAVAEGNFASACAALDGHARSSLAVALHSDKPCPVLLPRCFPNQALLLRKDQTQLLYATVDINLHGNRGVAFTGNTEVAEEVKEVSLVGHKGQWIVDSYGEEHCLRSVRRAPRRHHR